MAPTADSFQTAAGHADGLNTAGYQQVLTNQCGEESWPITGASFILLHREQAEGAKAEQMLRF